MNPKIENQNIDKQSADDKYSNLDILATTNEGIVVDIEMQITNKRNTIKRSVYYIIRLICSQMIESEDYSKTKKCISMNMLDFMLFEDNLVYNKFLLNFTETAKVQLLQGAGLATGSENKCQTSNFVSKLQAVLLMITFNPKIAYGSVTSQEDPVCNWCQAFCFFNFKYFSLGIDTTRSDTITSLVFAVFFEYSAAKVF